MLTAGDVYELAVRQSFGGSTLFNVLHFQLKGVPADPQASFQTLADDTKELLRVKQAAALTYVSWKATQVAGAGVTYNASNCRRSGGDFYEGNFTGTLTGGDASGAPGPSYTAVVVSLKSGVSGRSKRGQFYIGGIDANALDTTNRNLLGATYATAWTTALATYNGKYKYPSGTSVDFNWVIFSRFIASGCKYVVTSGRPVLTHVQAGDAVASVVNVTSATVRTALSPMNRRKIGVGI